MSLTPEQLEKRRTAREARKEHSRRWCSDPEYRHEWEMTCFDRTILALRTYLQTGKKTEFFPMRRGTTRDEVLRFLGDQIWKRKRAIEDHERARFEPKKGVIIMGPSTWFRQGEK